MKTIAAVLAALILGARQAKLDEFIRAGFTRGFSGMWPPLFSVTGAAWAHHAMMLGKTAALTAAFWGTGREILRRLELHGENVCEAAALEFATGAGAWALGFLLLGLEGALKIAPVALLAGAAFGIWALSRPSVKRGPFFKTTDDRWLVAAFGGLTALTLFVLWPHAAIAETFFDALEYHLGLPHLALLNGAIRATPDNAFAGVPGVMSMLFGWALSWDASGVTAHLFGLTVLGWICVALAGLGSRLGSATGGVVAGALFAGLPTVETSAFRCSAELGWTFFQLAGGVAFFAALQRKPEARRRWWGLCGFLLGTAMGTKYLAWGTPAGVLMYFAARRGRESFRDLSILLSAAAAVLAPWLLKNVLHYGNPIYPYFAAGSGWRYLGGGATLPSVFSGVGPYLTALLASPWRMVFYENNFGESMGALWLAVLALAAFSLKDSRGRGLALFSLGTGMLVGLVSGFPRYWIPTAALLCALAGNSIGSLTDSRLRRGLGGLVMIFSMGASACVWLWVLPSTRGEVFTGMRASDDFLSHTDRYYYPTPLFSAARYINLTSPPSAKILIFGDERGFQINRDYILSSPSQATVLERVANASSSGANVRERLAALGITHILVNHGNIRRENLALHFSPAGKSHLDDFWARYTEKVFAQGPDVLSGSELDRWVAVYRMLDAEEAASPHAHDDLFEAYNVIIKP
jgi:hypothetical protein